MIFITEALEDELAESVGEPVSEGQDEAAGAPVLVQHQHGRRAAQSVQAVEEVVLVGGQAAVVHGDAQAPGQQRD